MLMAALKQCMFKLPSNILQSSLNIVFDQTIDAGMLQHTSSFKFSTALLALFSLRQAGKCECPKKNDRQEYRDQQTEIKADGDTHTHTQREREKVRESERLKE